MKHKLARPAKNSVMLTTSLLALAVVPGCTWLNDVASDWPPQSKKQQQANQKQARTQSLDSPGAMADTQREYRYTQMPKAPEPQQERPGNSDMAGPRGLQVDQQSGRMQQRTRGHSGAKAQDRQPQTRQLGQRLSRIEKQLTMLRRDFADIKPVMRKVQAAERQIHQLSRELSRVESESPLESQAGHDRWQPSQSAQQRNTGRPPVTWQQTRQQRQQTTRQKAASTQQTGQQQTKPQQKPATESGRNQQDKSAESAYVKNVRIGTFKGNTRLVLDLSRPAADFSYDLDNRENLLVVEIDGAGWRAQEAQEGAGSDLISSISASTTRGGGSRMVVELSEQADIVRAQKLPPTGNNGHRIFMDLAAK